MDEESKRWLDEQLAAGELSETDLFLNSEDEEEPDGEEEDWTGGGSTSWQPEWHRPDSVTEVASRRNGVRGRDDQEVEDGSSDPSSEEEATPRYTTQQKGKQRMV